MKDETKVQVLNNEQRKMLVSIFTERLRVKGRKIKEEQASKLRELEKSILANDSNVAKLKAMVVKQDKFKKETNETIEKMNSEIEKFETTSGLSVNYDNTVRVGSEHKLIARCYKQETEQREKLEELENRMLADIWGLAVNYNELVKSLNEELKNI